MAQNLRNCDFSRVNYINIYVKLEKEKQIVAIISLNMNVLMPDKFQFHTSICSHKLSILTKFMVYSTLVYAVETDC